jgi:hypothetical protein
VVIAFGTTNWLSNIQPFLETASACAQTLSASGKGISIEPLVAYACEDGNLYWNRVKICAERGRFGLHYPTAASAIGFERRENVRFLQNGT